MIIAVGQHASLAWLPDEFKTERGTIKIDKFGRLGDTNFFAAGDIVQLGSGQPLMVVNAVGDGKRVAFNVDKVMRGEKLQPRTVAVDVILDLNRMNMTYFPHFPRVQQELLLPASRRKTQEEVIQAFSEEQAVEEAGRCFSCGTCNACDNCYLVCPEPCIARSARSTAWTRFWSTTAKVAAFASRSVQPDASRACPNWTSIQVWCEWIQRSQSRQGWHGRQAQELMNLGDRPAKNI